MLYRISTIAAFVALGLVVLSAMSGALVAYNAFFLAGLILTIMVAREFMRRDDKSFAVALRELVRPATSVARRQTSAALVLVALCLVVMGGGAVVGLTGEHVTDASPVVAH